MRWVSVASGVAFALLLGLGVGVSGGGACGGRVGGLREGLADLRPQTAEPGLIGDLITPRPGGHSATRLADGRVLIAGGTILGGRSPTARAEIYDPMTRSFDAAGRMREARSGQADVLLPDGEF